MSKFLNADFLLTNKVSRRLYHEYAAKQPIIDYHCHLSPQEIAEDKHFSSITELWLGGDHYKWRAMRSAGVPEHEITGSADARLKFQRWAETLPWCIGNPLYHWTHLELQRYFGIKKNLNIQNAELIWRQCNNIISQPEFSAQNIIAKSNVEIICTTDDPCDDLHWHESIASNRKFTTKVLPSFRPDKILNIHLPDFSKYINLLSQTTKISITTWEKLQEAISMRVAYFHARGCRVSDHALTSLRVAQRENINTIFKSALKNKALTENQKFFFQNTLLQYLASLYKKYDWTMQLHIGALRNANYVMFETLGPDTGFDTIGDEHIASGLAHVLSAITAADGMPRTVLYNLHPKDNFTLAVMIGAFQGAQDQKEKSAFGKMQFGSGWWYNDQKDGMIRQLTDLANLGVLGKFIGMLTDSRSFISYPRHEYFRRIFCNLLGAWVEAGEYPADIDMLSHIVKAVCYQNAKKFLQL